ncbi:c-type cytochrome [Sphingomonas crocodyli]|uniref:C-type cytochrome n=1 Tax=Sphingomonas crocodyli TaxID=1979270 RepID=A0A437MBA5_9SPHN|nr:c-type cytochrome [Sphingomonas crocodyli]RVT94927.1 c-type cytochrome [Sphingomonas crocodyli]
MRNRLISAVFAAAILAPVAPAAAAPLPKPPIFGVCAACHKVDKGAPNGIGPNLFGIGGETAGAVPGFAFSPAMKKSGIKWTRANLIKFIQSPQATIPGTRMPFMGLKNPQSAEQVADYILSLK